MKGYFKSHYYLVRDPCRVYREDSRMQLCKSLGKDSDICLKQRLFCLINGQAGEKMIRDISSLNFIYNSSKRRKFWDFRMKSFFFYIL